jgi:hypothetical protein
VIRLKFFRCVRLKVRTAETILKMVTEEVQQIIFCLEGLAPTAMQLLKLCPAHDRTYQWLAVVAVERHLERPTKGPKGREGWKRREGITGSIKGKATSLSRLPVSRSRLSASLSRCLYFHFPIVKTFAQFHSHL